MARYSKRRGSRGKSKRSSKRRGTGSTTYTVARGGIRL